MGRRATGAWLPDDPGQCQAESRPGICRHIVAVGYGTVFVGFGGVPGEENNNLEAGMNRFQVSGVRCQDG